MSSLAGLGGLGALAGLGGLSGLGTTNLQSPQSILSLTGNILPLIGLLPLDKLFPNSNSKDNFAIISSLPIIIKLANSISSFKLQVILIII